MTRGMNNGRKLKIRRYSDLVAENKALKVELDALKTSRKKDCVAFFCWWWNQLGTNTEQGYDEWAALAAEEEK